MIVVDTQVGTDQRWHEFPLSSFGYPSWISKDGAPDSDMLGLRFIAELESKDLTSILHGKRRQIMRNLIPDFLSEVDHFEEDIISIIDARINEKCHLQKVLG